MSYRVSNHSRPIRSGLWPGRKGGKLKAGGLVRCCGSKYGRARPADQRELTINGVEPCPKSAMRFA